MDGETEHQPVDDNVSVSGMPTQPSAVSTGMLSMTLGSVTMKDSSRAHFGNSNHIQNNYLVMDESHVQLLKELLMERFQSDVNDQEVAKMVDGASYKPELKTDIEQSIPESSTYGASSTAFFTAFECIPTSSAMPDGWCDCGLVAWTVDGGHVPSKYWKKVAAKHKKCLRTLVLASSWPRMKSDEDLSSVRGQYSPLSDTSKRPASNSSDDGFHEINGNDECSYSACSHCNFLDSAIWNKSYDHSKCCFSLCNAVYSEWEADRMFLWVEMKEYQTKEKVPRHEFWQLLSWYYLEDFNKRQNYCPKRARKSSRVYMWTSDKQSVIGRDIANLRFRIDYGPGPWSQSKEYWRDDYRLFQSILSNIKNLVFMARRDHSCARCHSGGPLPAVTG